MSLFCAEHVSVLQDRETVMQNRGRAVGFPIVYTSPATSSTSPLRPASGNQRERPAAAVSRAGVQRLGAGSGESGYR